jgi:hypothetical protein
MNIEKVGRRYYLRNLPFASRNEAKSEGCKWDPAEKAWWTGKEETARKVATELSTHQSSNIPGGNAVCAGRALYKGRTYYLGGKMVSFGWDQKVAPVLSQNNRYLLFFTDGSSQFWVNSSAVQIVKMYRRPQTIDSLLCFQESVTRAKRQGHEDGIESGRRYECEECGDFVTRGDGSSCWETGMSH